MFRLVNKSDINVEITEQIINYCEQQKLIYLGELPFDKMVTTAQREGKTIVEYECEISSILQEIFCLLTSIKCYENQTSNL